MTTIKHIAFALAVTLSALHAHAQAQTSGIEVTTDNQRAQFAVHGHAQKMRVEVYAPSGEMVFDSGTVTGRALVWQMMNQKGEPLPDGLYLATISLTEASGRTRKRIEQITINREKERTTLTQPPNAAQATITGDGTAGTIPIFTGASTIEDSIITGVAKRIGINVDPTSVLQVNGIQPTAVATEGATASTLLQTSGGKGGDTTGTSGQSAGAGASISLVAGNGGDAPAGGIRGNGGSITIQPGAIGGGAGTGGSAGNVLIAPTAIGNVGVGTNAPTSKLTVAGGDIQIATAGRRLRFADGSEQATAAITATQHDGTLSGDGTVGSPLSVAVPLTLSGSRNGPVLSVTNMGSGAAIFADGAINTTTQYNIEGERVLSVPGSQNTFVGIFAGNPNSTGSKNSFFGYRAGDSNTTGYDNSFFGLYAGSSNTTGSSNSFFGAFAGDSNTVGVQSAFFGWYAGNSNTTGTSNAFFGSNSGRSNTAGRGNSFFGESAGRHNTTGNDNSFFGQESGFVHTTGSNNAFFGEQSGHSNTSGDDNSFFGQEAGKANTTGHSNSFFGEEAGLSNTTGYSNAFFGEEAGTANTTGHNLTVVGVNAGTTAVGSSNNTLIGFNTEAAAGISNATAIGANAVVTTSNTMVLGTNIIGVEVPGKLLIGTLGVAGSQDLCRNAQNRVAGCSSSMRYKTDAQSYTSGLEVISRLRPISFRWREQGERDLGLAAEEVAAVEPLLVTQNAEGEVEGVKYRQINVVLINAVKEQQRQIEQLQSQVARLQRTVKQRTRRKR
jgi:Chaperone of endosialidase